MPDAVPAQCSPERLTAALRRAGILGDGAVREAVVVSASITVLSRIVRLRLSYDGAAPLAPASLIFKTGHPDRRDQGWNAALHEIAFYAKIAPFIPDRLVARCFDICADEATKSWHVLLEDFTDTHRIATQWPLPPTIAQCEAIVVGHARRHAATWDAECLPALMDDWNWRDEEAQQKYLGRIARQVGIFAERAGDILSSARRALYDRLLQSAHGLGARLRARRHLTIVQGDAHVWNCFLSRDGDDDDVRFFDWDSWRIDIGAADLAYMIAMHWYPDRRQRFERHLLDRYHRELTAAGVAGYDREMLDRDYRLAVLWQLTWPMWQEAYGIPPVIWWNNLERILLAVDDLECLALL